MSCFGLWITIIVLYTSIEWIPFDVNDVNCVLLVYQSVSIYSMLCTNEQFDDVAKVANTVNSIDKCFFALGKRKRFKKSLTFDHSRFSFKYLYTLFALLFSFLYFLLCFFIILPIHSFVYSLLIDHRRLGISWKRTIRGRRCVKWGEKSVY